MKKGATLLAILSVLLLNSGQAQKFYTKTGKISFFSEASLENIEAHNRSVTAVLDSQTGDLQFSVLMKGFEFKKALMQEHFNDKYMESDKYPKAEFKGQVVNNSEIIYSTDGSYPAKVNGQITIHGQTKPIETSGKIVVKSGKPVLLSSFNLVVADYNITIPRMYTDNISKTIKVTVEAPLTAL